MTPIQQFIRIRRDGKIIDETMKPQDISALGAIEKVTEIRWLNGSQSVSFQDADGVFAKVVPGRRFVAVNTTDKSGHSRGLLILNADGTQRFQISNTQVIRGKSEEGEFCWYELPRVESPNVFGIVFNISRNDLFFQLDIDAENGNVVGEYLTR